MPSTTGLVNAQLPRMTTLEEFDFAQAPKIPAARIRGSAEGGIHRAQRTGRADWRMRHWSTSWWKRNRTSFCFKPSGSVGERAALIVTTKLPFSEWTTVFPNPRLCKALFDRIRRSSRRKTRQLKIWL